MNSSITYVGKCFIRMFIQILVYRKYSLPSIEISFSLINNYRILYDKYQTCTSTFYLHSFLQSVMTKRNGVACRSKLYTLRHRFIFARFYLVLESSLPRVTSHLLLFFFSVPKYPHSDSRACSTLPGVNNTPGWTHALLSLLEKACGSA